MILGFEKTKIKIIIVLLIAYAFVNTSVGIVQCIHNSGDLRLINSRGEITFKKPDIYKNKKNTYGIRYPINSFIIMSPLFGFYSLGDKVVFYYLFLLLISIYCIPKLLLLNSTMGHLLKNEAQRFVLILMLATAATRAALNTGQIGIIFFALFLLAITISRQHPFWASFFLAISICKPQMGISFFLFMILQGHLACSFLALMIHIMALSIYCFLNKLNIICYIIKYISWQSNFSDHAWHLEGQKITSLHSIDFVNSLRTFGFSNELIIIVIVTTILFSAFLLYRYKSMASTQLAVVCITPLLLFYHRPYDYFLLWSIIPLLLSSCNKRMCLAVMLLVYLSMLLPYLPTFGYLQPFKTFSYVYYIFYVGLVCFNFIAIVLFSEKNRKNVLSRNSPSNT